jgi:type II secretory pathway component HofQ
MTKTSSKARTGRTANKSQTTVINIRMAPITNYRRTAKFQTAQQITDPYERLYVKSKDRKWTKKEQIMTSYDSIKCMNTNE